MRNQELQIVQVPFHGDVIEAVQAENGKILVHFKRVCEALGVNTPAQLRKMRDREWCEIVDLSTPDKRGFLQRLTMIDHESLPMWLATINHVNVRQETKPKLIAYQKEAKAVLSAWFLGTSKERPELARAFEEAKRQLRDAEAARDRQGFRASLFENIATENQSRCDLLLKPFGKGKGEEEYMTFREFCEEFSVITDMGKPLSGTQRRTASKKVAAISVIFDAPIGKAYDRRFGSVNSYRLDILMFWRAWHEAKTTKPQATFLRLSSLMSK